jgi:hypothetical protein
MKPLISLTVLILVLLSYSACKKSESAKPAQPTTVTKNTTTDPGTTIAAPPVAIQYPYTDTFVGTMHVTFTDAWITWSNRLDSTDVAYKFYVRHIDSHTIRFISSGPIELQQGSALSVSQLDTLNDITMYVNDMNLGRLGDHDNFVVNRALVFQLQGTTLSLQWDVPEMPLLGACDYGESRGEFHGILHTH